MNNKKYLNRLFNSDKPLIIYKEKKGFNIYTDFSSKINVNKSNIKQFLQKVKSSSKKKNKFFDGYIGFFGYELCCKLINIKIPNNQQPGFNKSLFYKPQTVIKVRDQIFISSTLKNFDEFKIKRKITNFFNEKKFNVSLNLKQYSRIFKFFSNKIRQGETYQIKVCQKYINNSNIDPIKFFWRLMKVNLSPESFLIRDKNYSIISCSPETLIEKYNNKIITKPIAGTYKKNSKISKKIAKQFFQKNIKENKEHNMIIDMERNDLNKICKTNSVKISKLKYVEEYKDLFHYVSEIKGTLKNNITILEIIKAMMPGGSVIGCPKINTLNLLNKQETHSRNIFTGSFGYIKSNSDMRFNIIIRSILNYQNKSEISVASGIVLDSVAKKEYYENFLKAKSLLEIFRV